MRRLGLSAAAAILILLGNGGPALAGGGATGNDLNDGGTAFVDVPGRRPVTGGQSRDDAGSRGTGVRGSRSSNCHTLNVSGTTSLSGGDTFYVGSNWCGGVFQGMSLNFSGSGGPPPPPPPPSGAEVAQQALASFTLMTPGIGTTSDGGVVRFPQWFWLTGGWAEQSATASLRGVSATVVARPVRALWQPGDGSSFSCDNPGMVYRGPQDAHLRPSCSHEYTRSSALEPGQRYRVTARVSFHMTWTSTDGTSGDLGTITSPAGSTTAGVGEIQAINVPNPPGVGGPG